MINWNGNRHDMPKGTERASRQIRATPTRRGAESIEFLRSVIEDLRAKLRYAILVRSHFRCRDGLGA